MQHPLFKVGTIFYSIWKMAQLNKLVEEKKSLKRIKGQLLNLDRSITQRTSAHKSFFKASAPQQAIHQQKNSNSIWNPFLASRVWICVLIYKQESSKTTQLCSTVQAPVLCCANSVLCILSLFCISVSTCISFASLVQTNAVSKRSTPEWAWVCLEAWYTVRFISWNMLISYS